MFTKKNAANATHYAVTTCHNTNLYLIGDDGFHIASFNTGFNWIKFEGKPYLDVIELSRPPGERKEDFLIPISYVKKFTPLVVGDTLLGVARSEDKFSHQFNISAGMVEEFNNGHLHGDYFVVAFADRPNIGKQPVSDDVVVDASHEVNNYTALASHLIWIIDGNNGPVSWKPNRAAMLKQYQASTKSLANSLPYPLNKVKVNDDDHYEQAHHITLQIEALGDQPKPLDFVIGEGFNYIPKPSKELINLLHKEVSFGGLDELVNDKPIFTQAMKCAGIVPPVGSECIFLWAKNPTSHTGTPVKVVIKYLSTEHIVHKGITEEYTHEYCMKPHLALNHYQPIDTRTDEEKLRDAINELWDAAPDKWAIIEDIIDSDKFTITLNKG